MGTEIIEVTSSVEVVEKESQIVPQERDTGPSCSGPGRCSCG